jgi:hypothetical protein
MKEIGRYQRRKGRGIVSSDFGIYDITYYFCKFEEIKS